jgi:hypothetical protein
MWDSNEDREIVVEHGEDPKKHEMTQSVSIDTVPEQILSM